MEAGYLPALTPQPIKVAVAVAEVSQLQEKMGAQVVQVLLSFVI